jgi:hypothetical protein
MIVLDIPNSGIDFEDKYIMNAPKNPPISQIGFTVTTFEYLVIFPFIRLIRSIKVIPTIKLCSVATLGVRCFPSCELILVSMVVNTPARIASNIKKRFMKITPPHIFI